MTLEKLQDLARLLGNSTWCRWWAWWSYPSREPWEIALSCIEIIDEGRGPRARAVPLPDLLAQGFREERRGRALYYVIARTNEDGTPFRSAGA